MKITESQLKKIIKSLIKEVKDEEEETGLMSSGNYGLSSSGYGNDDDDWESEFGDDDIHPSAYDTSERDYDSSHPYGRDPGERIVDDDEYEDEYGYILPRSMKK